MSTFDIATVYRDTGWKLYTADNAESPCAVTAYIRFVQRVPRGPISAMVRTGSTTNITATGANKFWKFSSCVPTWAQPTNAGVSGTINYFIAGAGNIGELVLSSPHLVAYVQSATAGGSQASAPVPAGWAGLAMVFAPQVMVYTLDDPI